MKKFVLVIEAKRSNMGSAMKQLLLSLKDMRDLNGQGPTVYGFTTTGDVWQMVIYDGSKFKVTDDFKVVFPKMKSNSCRGTRFLLILFLSRWVTEVVFKRMNRFLQSVS